MILHHYGQTPACMYRIRDIDSSPFGVVTLRREHGQESIKGSACALESSFLLVCCCCLQDRPNFPAVATTPISTCATRSASINSLHALVRASFCRSLKCKLHGVAVKAGPISCGFVAVLPRHSRKSPTAKQHWHDSS